jgi:hypothetical protein
MKRSVLRKLWAFVCVLGLVAFPSFAFGEAKPTTLKVQVNTPPSWAASADGRFAELFAASLREALTLQGLRWPVADLRAVEDPAKVPYLLKVDVTDWRMTESGDFSCTFAATLKTPEGERRIGVYSNTLWAPGVIYANGGHPFYALSAETIRTLCSDLAKCDLLPNGAGSAT